MSVLTVYLVEDSPTIRHNLIATLEELAPVRVVGSVDSAGDAVKALSTDPPPCDLAIVDVFLRQGSGLDVLQALRAHSHGPRRVVLTNYATPAIRAHCMALGADRVFDKSGEVEDLVSYCESLAALGQH